MFPVNTIIAWKINIYHEHGNMIITILLLPLRHNSNNLMCGPLTGVMSSIGGIVTLSKNVLLLVLRHTPSYDTVRTFFIKMWVIPKVMPQIREEFLPLLKCKTWRKKTLQQ